jgi:hypothetical protein
VIADVGPSFTTRRDGTVRAITGMLQFVEDPQDKAVLTGVAIQNLEGEGLQDVKAYWRKKMVGMGVTEPTDEEAQELAQRSRRTRSPTRRRSSCRPRRKKSLAGREGARGHAPSEDRRCSRCRRSRRARRNTPAQRIRPTVNRASLEGSANGRSREDEDVSRPSKPGSRPRTTGRKDSRRRPDKEGGEGEKTRT